jgi:uncharacterized protein (DUF1919 family)
MDYYLSLPLIENTVESFKTEYPVGQLGDITLHFNHYKSFEEAKEIYNRRKDRINKHNLLIVLTCPQS